MEGQNKYLLKSSSGGVVDRTFCKDLQEVNHKLNWLSGASVIDIYQLVDGKYKYLQTIK